MKIIIGSARIDSHGHAYGDSAGDQKQSGTPDYKGEVSMQDFYVHSKGWYIFRAKSDEHANKLAKCMKRACNNANIGYDQYQRDGIIKHHTDTKVKTECDCSSLVRECIIEATGKDPGNITTATMSSVLPKTGLFEDKKSYSSGTKLCTGDILVTKTSGHTVIVVDGADRGKSSDIAEPTLKKSDKGSEVRKLQRNLNHAGAKDKNGEKLYVDGNFGVKTEQSLKDFQKKQKIEVDGIYGKESHKAMKKALK